MSKKLTKSQKKQAVKAAKRHPKIVVAVAVILVVIIAAVAILWFIKPDLFHKLLGTGEHTWSEWETVTEPSCTQKGESKRTCSVCGEEETADVPATGHSDGDGDGLCDLCNNEMTISGSITEIPEAEFSIHFIKADNDRAGDCTLIKCGNTEVLIDAGPSQSSSVSIKSYLDEYVTDNKLEYVIATHADQDHIAGLVGTSKNGNYNGILYSYDIGTIIRFDKTNKKLTTDKGNPTLYSRFEDAVSYAVEGGAKAFTGFECYNETKTGASKVYYLDAENKLSMNILNSYYYDHNSADENNYSVCMLLKYEVDENEYKNYLFTGDLEESGEEYLVQLNQLPEVELFKAGHHGSPTSSNDCLLSVIKPKHVVCCCCAGTDEYTDTPANQFPSQSMIDRVAQYTDSVFVTNMISDNVDGYAPMNGNIVFYVDNKKFRCYCSDSFKKLKEWDWFKENRTCPQAWQ